MDELYKNKTKYTQKEYEIFLKSYKKEYAFTDSLSIIFNFVFWGGCMVLAFAQKEWLPAIGILIGLIVYIWYKFIRPATKQQEILNGPRMSGKFVNSYTFYQNYFDVENPEGNAKIYYMKIYKMVEAKEYYYIYLTKELAYIVSKIGFTKGNSDEFSVFMKKKLFRRYKNRMKRDDIQK